MKKITSLLLMFVMFTASAGVEKERKEVLEESQEILQRLYKEEPSTKAKVAKAAGYATFSNIGVNIIFVSAGGGNGLVHNNKTGKNMYMKMGTVGVGIGFGVKDFRAVFIFHEEDAMQSFIEEGWDFSGQADAAAKSGKKGHEGSTAGTIINGVSIYQMTESGLALQATLQGTKYWKDEDLN
jgi:lipid-binding SYLF domain-containing protein